MLEVLKVLMAKVDGSATVITTAMILIFMLGTATTINHFMVCSGMIIFLAVFFIVIQMLRPKEKEEKKE